MPPASTPALAVALRQAAALHRFQRLAVVRLEADGGATLHAAWPEPPEASGEAPADADIAEVLGALGGMASYTEGGADGATQAIRLPDRRHVLIAWGEGPLEPGVLAETGELVTALIYDAPGGAEVDHARLFQDLAADAAPLADRLVGSLARGTEMLGMDAGLLLCVEAEEWCVEAVHDPRGLVRIDPLLASGGLASVTYRASGAVGLHDVPAAPFSAPEGIRSFLGAPIVAGRHGLGVIVFLGAEPREGPFPDAARGLAETLARWAGVALHARRTERRAASVEGVLDHLLATSPAAAGTARWISGTDGRDDLVITHANDNAVRLLGIGDGDALSDALSPAAVRMWTGACRRAADGDTPQRFRSEALPPGADAPVRLSVSLSVVEPSADGRAASVVFIALDVTARRLVREHLHDREAQLRALLERAPILLFETDESGVFTFAEGRALALSGLRPQDLLGASVFERYRRNPDATQAMGRVLAGEHASWALALGSREFEVRASPARDREGRIVGARGVAVDVTERRAAERERAAAAAAAARDGDLAADLASLLSHGLRAPLATVRGFADLLAEGGDDPEEVRSSAGAIGRAADEILATLDGFLALSQPAGVWDVQRSAVGEAGLRAGLQHALAAGGIAADLELEPLASPVLVDLALASALLQQVAVLAEGVRVSIHASAANGVLLLRLTAPGLAGRLAGETMDAAQIHHAAAALRAEVASEGGAVEIRVPAPEAPVVQLPQNVPPLSLFHGPSGDGAMAPVGLA